MEIEEVIKWFEWAEDVYYCSMPNAKPDDNFYKQSKKISNLLKSLKTENKRLKGFEKAWIALTDVISGVIADDVIEKIENKYLKGEE
jgi:hypothetical protein